MKPHTPGRVIAIDWSGAESPAAQRRGIRAAVCEVKSGAVELRPGLLRVEVERWLLALMAEQAPVVAALDFSFSYPAWFVQEIGCQSAPELWSRVAEQGEAWLRQPHPHFWGRRKGSGLPAGHRAPRWLGYRACERAVNGGGRLPLSSFQIGGAGAVGTGTLRGMPMLGRLRTSGWSVWPFDAPGPFTLVEMYPRVLTGPVVKSSASARTEYLRQPRFAGLSGQVRAEAEAGEDAFDAVVSAMVMRQHAEAFGQLAQAADQTVRLEGAIWKPSGLAG